MTSKERVVTALASLEPDRVPINYFANAGIERRLRQYFGVAPDDSEGLLQALGVDFREVGTPYCGPKLHEDIPERGVKVDDWGIHLRWVEHETGGYWDYCDFPLRNASEEEVAKWPMPSPDDFDYSGGPGYCRRNSKYALQSHFSQMRGISWFWGRVWILAWCFLHNWLHESSRVEDWY